MTRPPKSANKWYDKLTEEMSSDWKHIMIGSKQRRKDLIDILNEIHKEMSDDSDKELCPQPYDIFAFCRYTDIQNIRAIIIGQDPYPNKHACGICFSSLQDKQPQSFIMIKKALIATGCLDAGNKCYDLRAWAYQGVLLINTAFTTYAGQTKAHSGAWSTYFNCILKSLVKQLEQRKGMRSVMWLLWGVDAIAKEDIIKSNQTAYKQVIMHWGHPSMMASHNKDATDKGNFIKCDHFRKVMQITERECGIPLYWDALSRELECFTDGSAKPNKSCPEAKGGYAVVFSGGPLKGLTIAGCSDTTVPHPQSGEIQYTNNIRAEGEALIEALRALENLPDDMWDRARIITDCEFYKQLVTKYIPSWLESKKMFDDQKNPDINREIWRLYVELTQRRDKHIIIEHMNSHTDKGSTDKTSSRNYRLWFWNKYVDRIASHARDNFSIADSPIKSYSFVTDYFDDMQSIVDSNLPTPESDDGNDD